jgi:NAD-dependent deacetylase
MEEQYRKAADIIKKSHHLIALTGAGISVESGIPDFRGPGGLWEKFDPMVYAHIDSFRKKPGMVWKMMSEMIKQARNAKPNPAHYALVELEKMKLLKSIITQNIDNLHQEAGTKSIIEFHGNASNLICIECHSKFPVDDYDMNNIPPSCRKCGEILKPDVVLFGETIPTQALMESQMLASSSDAILVIGTSAVVYPASSIPYKAKQNGAKVIEMNIEHTGITGAITDVFIEGNAGATLPRLVEYINM